ncbi:MAG: glycosyltransferase family 39 protein [Pirellulaceae bacterium]|nr:glycosyltransferase family 39 protein [Pirellulaceae bacterium]
MKRKRQQPSGRDATVGVAPAEISDRTPAFAPCREYLLLALILLAGTAARVVAYSNSSVEHYDEGVYATRFWFAPPDYGYPLRRLHAPPLLPAIIQWGLIAGLPPKLAALGPSLAAGCATIVAIWWVARSWFHPAVGLIAATLCAGSEFHIAYSASALTDVLLTLWLILALQCLGFAWRFGEVRWSVLAGLFTGLAWWTKYTGWLPLAIGLTSLAVLAGIRGIASWQRIRESSDRQLTLVRQAALLLLVVVIAGIIWLPYWISLQFAGGYAPIAANHAKYVVGLWGWPSGLGRQIAAQQVMQGWLGPLAVGSGVLLATMFPRLALREMTLPRAVALGWLVAAGYASLFVTSIVGGALGIVLGFWALGANSQISPAERERSLPGLVLLSVWWCSLALATPCYWPYPRLVLPWLAASWIGTAFFIARIISVEPACKRAASPVHRRFIGWSPTAVFVASVVAAILLPLDDVPGSLPGRDRRALESIARQIRAIRPGDNLRAIYVYGEPALLFQLLAAGEPIVSPLEYIPRQPASKSGEPIETWLVVGPHVLAEPAYQAAWQRVRPQWEILQIIDYHPSQLVWLDDQDPTHRNREREQSASRFQVARLRWPPR